MLATTTHSCLDVQLKAAGLDTHTVKAPPHPPEMAHAYPWLSLLLLLPRSLSLPASKREQGAAGSVEHAGWRKETRRRVEEGG